MPSTPTVTALSSCALSATMWMPVRARLRSGQPEPHRSSGPHSHTHQEQLQQRHHRPGTTATGVITALLLQAGGNPMSRHIQVTFDAHDPQALSSFWRDVTGLRPPRPARSRPGRGCRPAGRVGRLPRAGRRTGGAAQPRSAIEDPDGHGPRLFFQQVRRTRSPRTASTSTSVRLPDCTVRSGCGRWRSSATGSSRWERRGTSLRARSPDERVGSS